MPVESNYALERILALQQAAKQTAQGFGAGLKNQAMGLAQMLGNPLQTLGGALQGAHSMVLNSRPAEQAMRQYLSQALSSPQNLGQAIGENIGPGELAKGLGAFGAMAKMSKKLPGSIDDYQGLHTPPLRDSGAPGHDLTGGGTFYPDDVYGPHGAQYYGHYGQNDPMDMATFGIVNRMKGNPNAEVTIYRAVPYELSPAERITEIESQKAAYLRRATLPEGVIDARAWYDGLSAELEKLRAMPDAPAKKLEINKGDWVTVNRKYAKEHGESALEGKYKIISKKVKAKDIFTNGDSIHEWGYDPTP